MDNNMINIDDLFRQRLSGAEEKERAGAWMRMSDLLDNKMPVKAAGANWRRMLGYTAGLLLLASATIGSYEAIHAFRGHGEALASGSGIVSIPAASKNTNNESGNKLNNNVLSSATATDNKNDHSAIACNIEPKKSNKNSAKHNKSINNTQNNENEIVANENASLTLNSGSASTSSIASNENLKIKDNSINQEQAKLTSSNTSNETKLVAKKTHNNKGVNAPKLLAGLKVASVKPQMIPASASSVNVSNNKHISITRQHIAKMNATNLGIKPASNTAAVASAKNMNMQATETKRVMMDKLQVSEHFVYDRKTQRGIYHTDTISRDKVNIITNENQGGNEMLAMNAKQTEHTLLPNSSFNDKSTLNAQKKESRKGGNFTFLDHFNAMIDNFKYNFKHIQFTPGVSAGINGTFFGPYSLKGFQMGVSGNIALNDNWNMMVDLRYFNRLNNNTINDNYATYVNEPGTGNYVKYSTQHSFDFSNIHSFEMPVTIRYSFRQFIFFGGANLAYNLAINASETSIASLPIMQSEPGVSTQPKLSVNDFSSCLGFGYTCGIGYQCTPNLQVDLGLTQNFWNNAKTNGASLLSDDFYRQPSLQISIGYQFVRELKMIRK